MGDAGGGGAAAVGAELPRTAMTAPTGAATPTSTLIACRMPDSVAGTSTVTLSVSISHRFSPAATVSPTDLNHWTTVPSDTVSPSWGMSTFIDDRLNYQFTETYCGSRNSMMPSWAPSRPMPLCFM